MNYSQALDYLNSRINYEHLSGHAYSGQVFKLDRVVALDALLGYPSKDIKVIHVTGTKGKGSTASFITHALMRSGFRTGLFQSPHIFKLEERFQVNMTPCSPAELAALVTQIKPALDRLDGIVRHEHPEWGNITWFEIITLMAFLYFRQKKIDVAVMEVGMGGRLDATNICSPCACVITSISLDHMAQLGNSIEAITREKAGIIKPHVPVISGILQPEARKILETYALEKNAPLIQINRDFFPIISDQSISRFSLSGHGILPEWTDTMFTLQMDGVHQIHNASLSAAVLSTLQDIFPVTCSALKDAFLTTQMPGRLECLHRNPDIILDVAHNTASMECFVAWMNQKYPNRRRWVVFAVSKDKNWQEMLRLLTPEIHFLYLTRYFASDRSASIGELEKFCREQLTNFHEIHTASCGMEAVSAILKQILPGDVIIITGSFFLASEVRNKSMQKI